jgi:hypothetical protein
VIKSKRAKCVGHVAGKGWFWWGNLRERDHWVDPGIDGRIIFKFIFRNWDVVVWTGLSWLSIGTVGGHL